MSKNSLINGNCIYGKKVQKKSIVVYKASCNICGCYYIGNTQQKLKARMNAHFSETKDLANNNKQSDSFAKHFASHFKDKEIARGDVRKITSVDILWQGKPISCVKTFKKLNCSLCTRERLEIYQAMKKEKENNTNLLINSLNELYGACRHNPRFHRYCTIIPQSADDAANAENV